MDRIEVLSRHIISSERPPHRAAAEPGCSAVVIGGMVLDVQVRTAVMTSKNKASTTYNRAADSYCTHCKWDIALTWPFTPTSYCDGQAKPTGQADVVGGGSVPGVVRQAYGGVGRNIAHCLALLTRQAYLSAIA